MKLYDELVKSNKKSAAVDIILSGNNFFMIPRGRSVNGNWYGLQYLDYLVTNNKNQLFDIKFIDKVLNAIDVSINYDRKNIDKNEKLQEIVSNFILRGEGVRRISINLDVRKPNSLFIYKFVQSSSGDFSANPNDAIIIDDNSNEKEFLEAISTQLGLNKINTRK